MSRSSNLLGTRRHPSTVILETILGAMILASVVPYTHDLPFLPSYVPVIILYTLLLCYALFHVQGLAIPRYALFFIGTIWIVFLYHFIAGPLTVPLVVRIPIFIVFSLVNLFYLPRVIPLERFASVTAFVVALIVCLGLLNFVVGAYTLWMFDVTQWRWPFSPFPIVTLEIRPIKSVFHNVNPYSHFALMGTFVAMIAYLKYRSRLYGFLVVVNGTGLFLSNSRGAFFAAAVSVAVFLLYRYGRRWQLSVGVFAMLGGVVVVLLMLVGAVPAIGPLPDISLSGRGYLWRGAVRAALSHPLFGYGPGDTAVFIAPFVEGGYAGTVPHNSYLRLLVTTGFVGLTAYVLFILLTIRSLVNVPDEPMMGMFLALFVGLCVHQLFENYSIFGLSSTSVVTSLVFGYAIQRIQKQGTVTDIRPRRTGMLLYGNELVGKENE